jgi:hypothetical protein
VIGYVRASTDKQDLSPEAQEKALRDTPNPKPQTPRIAKLFDIKKQFILFDPFQSNDTSNGGIFMDRRKNLL